MELNREKLLIIEPFYGGYHKKLIDNICSNLPANFYKLITMTAKKWHWRARTSALYISSQIPHQHSFKTLFCSSVLPLAELLGLRPDLANVRKVVYFHENQLEIPVCVLKDRDFQYGYNEILTCLAADQVLFNSSYNRNSFLSCINNHLTLQADFRIGDFEMKIKEKSAVSYYPLDLNTIDKYLLAMKKADSKVLHIVWPHRWEFDKDPDTFYRVLCKLDDNGQEFKVSLLGESFHKKPEIFCMLLRRFTSSRILHCGYVESTKEYYRVLKNADVVVSTALHEFFGVPMLEAVYCGCIPIVPKRLSYKELFEDCVEEIYETEADLYEILARLCKLKQVGDIKKDYSYLALPFESHKWFEMFLDTLCL